MPITLHTQPAVWKKGIADSRMSAPAKPASAAMSRALLTVE